MDSGKQTKYGRTASPEEIGSMHTDAEGGYNMDQNGGTLYMDLLHPHEGIRSTHGQEVGGYNMTAPHPRKIYAACIRILGGEDIIWIHSQEDIPHHHHLAAAQSQSSLQRVHSSNALTNHPPIT